jgi:tetratricopeptide (TPR) repeat protein
MDKCAQHLESLKIMSDELLNRLLAAETPTEEMLILLSTLPQNLAEVVWAAAVPHWFNAEILVALRPNLAIGIDDLYLRIQAQPYVELFQDRGHNIHESTRAVILELWWKEKRKEYRRLSSLAEEYFSSKKDEISLVEAAYHSLVAHQFDSAKTSSQWSEIASQLKLSGKYSLGHTLVLNAREHALARRISSKIYKLVDEWGQTFANDLELLVEERIKSRDLSGASEIFGHAQLFYADTGDKLAEANLLVKLGAAHRKEEQFDEAHAELEKALEMYLAENDNGNTARVLSELGSLYFDNGNLNKALEACEHGLSLNPLSVECITLQGKILLEQKNRDHALDSFTRAVELDPENAHVLVQRGIAYRLMGQYEAALVDFNRAIELRPEDSWAITHRGVTYGLIKKYEAALADFNRAIELDPEDSWAIASRGVTYQLMKQYEAALVDFNRAIELKPEYNWAITHREGTYRSMKKL